MVKFINCSQGTIHQDGNLAGEGDPSVSVSHEKQTSVILNEKVQACVPIAT